jgi:hypothetical protein
MAVGITPAWGAIMPHAHLTRGFVNQADWQAHLEEHLHGIQTHLALRCLPVQTDPDGSVLASFPDANVELSLAALFAAVLPPARIEADSIDLFRQIARPGLTVLTAPVYPPPDPPPNS